MQWNLSTIADIIGVLGALIGALNWINIQRIRSDQKREQDRLSEKVRLTLKAKDSGDFIELPGEMRREEVTRAEVLGWIGMLPMKEKGKRFEIAYTNSADFLRQLSEVQTGSGDVTILIHCAKQELSQFAAKAVKPAKAKRLTQ